MAEKFYPMVVRELRAEDGGGYFAYAPDLPGCIADGETAEEAITNLTNAVEEWLDEAKELGRTIPKPGEAAELVRQQLARIQQIERDLERLAEEIEQASTERERMKTQELWSWYAEPSLLDFPANWELPIRKVQAN